MMNRKSFSFPRLVLNNLLYSGLSKDEFEQVRKPVGERNRHSIVSWSIILGLFWAASLAIYHSTEYTTALDVFRAALLCCVITLLCGLFLVKRFPATVYPVMCFLELSVFGTGIGLSLAQPDQRVATLIAAAVMTPSFFIDRTIVSIVLEAVSLGSFAVLGKDILTPEIYSWGLLTISLFSIAGILIGHVNNKARFERYVFSDTAEKLANIQMNYNAELKKEVALKTEQIVALNDQLVMGMATMVESRDNSTGGHIRRTSAGVRILADAMRRSGSLQMSDEFYDKIIKAAPMHDLGKISVADMILRKPGRYDPEEFKIMKTHAAEGAHIIHEILKDGEDEEFIRIAENIAHYHHERVDGSGYPDGLKGDDIPLEARIMAIADVYDALVSKRVYKEKYSFEKANQIILEGMGSQFDAGLKDYYEAARPALEAYYRSEQ